VGGAGRHEGEGGGRGWVVEIVRCKKMKRKVLEVNCSREKMGVEGKRGGKEIPRLEILRPRKEPNLLPM
jgi:hypothetical protein